MAWTVELRYCLQGQPGEFQGSGPWLGTGYWARVSGEPGLSRARWRVWLGRSYQRGVSFSSGHQGASVWGSPWGVLALGPSSRGPRGSPAQVGGHTRGPKESAKGPGTNPGLPGHGQSVWGEGPDKPTKMSHGGGGGGPPKKPRNTGLVALGPTRGKNTKRRGEDAGNLAKRRGGPTQEGGGDKTPSGGETFLNTATEWCRAPSRGGAP